jgi:hypothetical protein
MTGILGGLLWGVAIRSWMRFISTDPEFTWSGTSFIVGAATLVGTSLGIAFALSRRSRAGWWRLLGLTAILLGAGAGAIMVPGTVVGGLAFGHWNWPKAVRLVLGTLAIAGTALLAIATSEEMSTVKTAAAIAIFASLHAIEMKAVGIVFAPSREGRQ